MAFTSRCRRGLLVLVVLTSASAWAQPTPSTTEDNPERNHALELYKQGKFVDAMPLLEKLAADHPSDYALKEGWGWCIFQYAATLSDSEQRKKVRARARKIAVEANRLGDNSQLLQVMLEVPEDGSEAKFSDRKEVDEAMKSGEAEFARGDLDKAREAYLRALLLDPNDYEAALFTGDSYFKQHVYGSAGEWFSRAIQINLNRETAYRYWGDALVALGKEDDARAKYIDAIVAEPYTRSSWVGLTNWLQHNKLQINYVKLTDRATFKINDSKNSEITIDNSLDKNDPNGLAWTAYGLGRAGWHTEKTEKEFPNVPRDRHTLQEESYALNFMITVLKEQEDYANLLSKLDPSLRSLVLIQEAGFLEPFVLLNRADNEVAQDYESYRTTNRTQIRRYLDEFVVPKTPAETQKQ